jgi:hypothetical protein
MAYSVWDKQPEMVFPQIPFEFLTGLAEKQSKRLDLADEQIGKTKGLFAALNAAPGHEDLATGLTKTYNDQLNNLVEKHKNNLGSREFVRELTSISSNFANDQNVQTVVSSKDWFDKNSNTLWDAENKNAVINAPGIINSKGEFEQNKFRYGPDKFNITYYGDPIKEIQEQFNIQKEARIKELGLTTKIVDGEVKYYNTATQTTYKDEDILAPVAESTYKMLMENPEAKPGFSYWHAKNQNLSTKEKSEAAKALIKNAGVPFYFKHLEESSSPISGGDSPKEGTDKSPAIKGTPVTTALDYVTGVNNRRITSTEGLEGLIREEDANVTSVKGKVLQEFPDLGDTPFHHTINGEEINLDLIKDPQLKSRAAELNAQLVEAQIKKDSHQSILNHFKSISGYDPDQPMERQVDFSKLQQAAASASAALNLREYSSSSRSPIGSVLKTFSNKEELFNYLAPNGIPDQAALAYLEEWDRAYSKTVTALDSKYAEYNNKLTNYLNSTIYKPAFSYTVASEDENELRSTVIRAAANPKNITRANFGPESGNRGQYLSAEEMTALQQNAALWKDAVYSVRFDESTNSYVADVTYGGETYEINAGIADLGKYVQKIDPQMHTLFLEKQQLFMQRLAATDGRASTITLYKDAGVDSNGAPIQEIAATPKVKSAFQAISEVGVNSGDYLFKVPGLNKDNVIKTSSFWDLARFTDSYNAIMSRPGLTTEQRKSLLDKLFANPGQNITIFNGKIGKVNERYFSGTSLPEVDEFNYIPPVVRKK